MNNNDASPPTDRESRAAFEKHARRTHLSLARSETGQMYDNPFVESEWRMWQRGWDACAAQSPEPGAKPRDLQNLCDRLAEVFNLDDTPEELSAETREAIEELWESRDNYMKWALHLQTCTDCHVGDHCAVGKPLAAAVQPETKSEKLGQQPYKSGENV